MVSEYRVLHSGDFGNRFNHRFALDILEGLSRSPKKIPSVYFYDEKGSHLFKEITGLEEYYLTGCEVEILNRHGAALASLLPKEPLNILELGAGDGRKSLILLECLLEGELSIEYMPLDISSGAMEDLLRFIGERLSCSNLKITGLVAEYFDVLQWLNRQNGRRNVALFLGSSIGNFDREDARTFLRHLWDCLKGDDLLLIGFDLKKEIEVMERAYNDARGVTEAFNLNLLDRINRELKGNFDQEKFNFCSRYNASSGAVESWLISRESQEITLEELGRTFLFDAWEGVHTESSHKYSVSEIESLAKRSGFSIEENFFDSRTYFVDSLWRVRK
jgi:L-histidine Nalpha-methyltransferase